jgi:hypothetical protein
MNFLILSLKIVSNSHNYLLKKMMWIPIHLFEKSFFFFFNFKIKILTNKIIYNESEMTLFVYAFLNDHHRAGL